MEIKKEKPMSKILKNFYTTAPDDFKPGDVFACVIALHYVSDYEDGTPEYRMYRCAYPDTQTSDGIPQGQNIGLNEEIMQRLFPTAVGVREMAKQGKVK